VQRHPTPNRPSQRSATWWLLVTFGTFWAGLLLHEAAHFAVARVLFAPDDWVRVPAYGDFSRGIAAAAGPLVPLLTILVCAIIAARSRQPIAIAAGLGAASRIFLVAVPTMLGRPNDEQVVSVVTGLPGPLIWTAEAAVTTLLIAWMLRSWREQLRVRAIAFCLVGAFLGWISALTLGLPI
jgi:hypothetical protein